MLAAFFVSIGIGLAARRFGRGQHVSIIAVAVVMTALYTFLGYRFV